MKKRRLGSRGKSFIYESDDGTLFQKCVSCNLIVELCSENFWKQRTTKSGYRSKCKKCLGFKETKRWGVKTRPSKDKQNKRMNEWKARQPAGIYKITCMENGRVYIGESKCLPLRWISHKSALNCEKGKTNKLLQEDWDLYGEGSFTFETLEQLEKDKDLLYGRELFYIKQFDEKGFKLYNRERLENK